MESRPKRGTAKRRLSFYLAVLLSLIIAFLLFTKSGFLSYQVSKYVNDHLLDDPRFEFSCQKISGNLLSHVVVHRPILRYHSPEASFNVFRADEVTIDYDILEAVKLNLAIEDLRLRNVRLQIRKDDSGLLILPVPTDDGLAEGETSLSPRADVQNFVIDGLQVYFGGGERELAVRDVDLRGSLQFAQGVGRLEIEQGSAYLIDSETSVQAVRVDVTVEKNAMDVRNFTARFGRSFVVANGAYENGSLKHMQFIFNPIVLEEVHTLGLIPDMSGEFGGNVILDGALDSLSISGNLAGAGLGIAVSGLSFDATVANNRLDFSKLEGDVFGARVEGEFHYELTGENSYWFDGECGGLDLTQGFLPDRGLPETDLYGRVMLEFDGGSESYTFEAKLDSARIDDYYGGGVAMMARWSEEYGLEIENFELSRPGYTVDGSGRIDAGGTAEIVFALEGDDLSYLWDYTSLPPISGAVSVRGKLSGPTDNLQINLNGSVAGIQYLFVEVDSGIVQAEVRGVGGDDVSASVDVAGNTILLGGQPYKTPHLFLETYGGTTLVRDFSFSKGDTFATTDFEVSAVDDTASIEFKHIAITTPTEEWRTTKPATLLLHEGSVRVDSFVFVSQGGVIGISGVYSKRDKSCDLDGWGENVDLGLLRDALGLPVRLEGRSEYEIEIGGQVDNPTVAVNVTVRDGAVDSLEFDLLRLSGEFDGKRYRLSDLLVVNENDSIAAVGWSDLAKSPFVLFSGDRDPDELTRAPFRLEVASRHFPVPAVMNALRAPTYVGGVYTGTAIVENTAKDPDIHLHGFLTPRPGKGIALLPISLDVSYRDGKIDVRDITVSGDFGATLTGSVPVSLDLIDGFRADYDRPLRLDLIVHSADLSRFEPYTDALSLLAGEVEGSISVGGSMGNPVFNGRLVVSRGAVKFAEMDETYTDINATVDFVDNIVRLSSINGRSRDSQAFFGSGSMTLSGFKPSDYRLDVLLRDFWVTVLPEFEGRLNGNLTVTAVVEDDGRLVPNITGKLTVVEASVEYSFETTGGKPATVTLPTTSPGWTCSIDLDADHNVWVRNPDMNIELGGQLILKRDNTGLYFRGDLSILRGFYTVYNNKFRIIDGSLNFSAAEVLRPEVYINAYTPHRIEGGQERRIYLTLTWPRDKKEPTLQLSYDDPGYYETDIWRMLGGNDIAGGLAANTLEKLLNQQMSGLTIDVGRRSKNQLGSTGDPETELTIGVGKYLWEDVYLRYKQGLTLSTEQEVEVEYRISKMFLVRSQIIRHADRRHFGNIRQTADEYNLDVKFRFEY